MKPLEPWCCLSVGGLVITGELTREECARFVAEVAAVSPLPDPLWLDLRSFDIADGMAAVAALNAVRHLARGRRLILHGAPQILAHNLYRVGDLEGGSLVLEATREDEPYG